MPLTPEQQNQVVELMPIAKFMARRYKIDDGAAYLALCEAVLRYDPAQGDLKPFAKSWISKSCKGNVRHESQHREFPVRFSRRPIPDERELLESLPEYLHEVARLYWIGRHSKGEITELTGLDPAVVSDRIKIAAGYLKELVS